MGKRESKHRWVGRVGGWAVGCVKVDGQNDMAVESEALSTEYEEGSIVHQEKYVNMTDMCLTCWLRELRGSTST